MMGLVRTLDSVSFQDLATCGGKAARLGEALRLGCPVLPGVVLSTDLYRRFMQQGGLQGEIASILATMQPTTLTHFQAVEWAVQSAFKVRRLPKEISETIQAAWRSLGGVPVAVRSSATNEDSPFQSFVGQHATFLDVDSEEAAIEAVLGCWMSLFSAKALSYAQRFGVDLLNSAMAVLMQPMVTASTQGALFTVDPITGNPDVFVLEIQKGPGQGVHRLDPYQDGAEEPAFWRELRRLGLLLDEHELAYQAIEWCIADEQLYFLRVRPATQVPHYLPLDKAEIGAGRGPLELIRPPDCTPREMRPYSWYHRSRSAILNAVYFKQAHRLFSLYAGREEFYICGYLYARYRHFPFPISERTHRPLQYLLHTLRRLYAARKLDREFRALWREKRPRLAALNERDLSSLSNEALAQFLREVMLLSEAFWTQCGHLGDSDRVFADLLQRLHEHWVEADSSSPRTLLWTRDDERSQALEELCELARATYSSADEEEEAFQSFFHRYRHLFLQGNPLAEWQDICFLQEDPSSARQEWQKWAQNNGPTLREQNMERLCERLLLERQILARLGKIKGTLYRYILGLARRYAPLRRDCEAATLLCRLLERDAVRESGRRLHTRGLTENPLESHLLGCREIIDWLEGNIQEEEIAQLLQRRRGLYRRWWRYAPPDILTDEAKPPAIEIGLNVPPEDVLRGLAVSPGFARGRARVVTTLTEATNILPREVLVCREPLFELSPLFGIVSAVIAERGGLLDHASVLAREYQVPAIFSVPEATQKIKTGEELHVDANNGIIVRHHPEPKWDTF
ncbi:MAG: hypothetical protein J7M05_11370 [Anaerolineae bacterium]|nr:hypothetical protein [Anaerolineae bacterium]